MLLYRAIALASLAHHRRKRRTGENYIMHPIRVMEKLQAHHLPQSMLIAAVLHDTGEEDQKFYPSIGKHFGIDIQLMVYFLSKGPKSLFQSQKKRLRHYLQKLEQGAQKYPCLLLIKMSDQIDNLSSSHVFPLPKAEQQHQEIQQYFVPLYSRQRKHIPYKYKKAYRALLHELKAQLKHHSQKPPDPWWKTLLTS